MQIEADGLNEVVDNGDATGDDENVGRDPYFLRDKVAKQGYQGV